MALRNGSKSPRSLPRLEPSNLLADLEDPSGTQGAGGSLAREVTPGRLTPGAAGIGFPRVMASRGVPA